MKNLTYNLYSTERIYRNETLVSYYFQPNRNIKKKCKPVDINGERFRLYDDGLIENYKRKDVEKSYGASLRRTIILMNMLLNMNDFYWFWTLTFDKEKIDRTNDLQVFKCYERYIDNIKTKFPSFRYMTFPERHEDGCFHFHLLTAGLTPAQMGLVNSGKVCCHWAKKRNKYGVLSDTGICSRAYFERTKHLHELKDTDGETIFNVTSFAYGFTTCSRIVSRERCNSYVKKYVQKALGSTEVFKKRFYYSSNLKVPEVVKRLVGADFEKPADFKTDFVDGVDDSLYLENSKGQPYINQFNVLQIKIDNEIKNALDKGLIPTDINFDNVFDYQMSMFDKKS